MNLDFPSTSYDASSTDELHGTFWVIFFVWLGCSMAWIVYCFVSHRRELKLVEKINRENRVSRMIEMQRLLLVYNSVSSENPPVSRK